MCSRYYIDDDTLDEVSGLLAGRKSSGLKWTAGDVHPGEMAPIIMKNEGKYSLHRFHKKPLKSRKNTSKNDRDGAKRNRGFLTFAVTLTGDNLPNKKWLKCPKIVCRRCLICPNLAKI